MMPVFAIRINDARASGSMERALLRISRSVHLLPSPGILVHAGDADLMRIHQTLRTGRVDRKEGFLRAGGPGFSRPRIVRKRLNMKSTSASTTGMPIQEPIS